MNFYNCYFYIKDSNTNKVIDSFFYTDRDENVLFSLKNYKFINKCTSIWNSDHLGLIQEDIYDKYRDNYEMLSSDDIYYHDILLDFIKKALVLSFTKDIYIHFKFIKQ